jgi:hypothetical protein
MLSMTPKENLSGTSLNPLNSDLLPLIRRGQNEESGDSYHYQHPEVQGDAPEATSVQTGKSGLGVKFDVPLRLLDCCLIFCRACVIHL